METEDGGRDIDGQTEQDEAEFVLRHAKWMDDVESIDVSVTWRNAASPPTGRAKRTMYRDD